MIHNLSLVDFLKISFYRMFRIKSLERSYWIGKSIVNWWDYYFVYLGLKKKVSLKFRTGENRTGSHDSFWEDLGDVGAEALVRTKLAKHADLIREENGFLVVMHEGFKFVLNRLSQAIVLLETFVFEQYKDLQASNKIVVDIGASIGDSSVYFSKVKKAKQVIAFEPYPKSYALARANLQINGVENVILRNEGLGTTRSTIHLDPEYESGVSDNVKPIVDGGTEIGMTTLHDVVENYRIERSSILKIDCEGCEYGVILNSSTQDLGRFDEILIESHYGYADLEKKLRSSGFKVKRSAAWYHFNPRANPQPHMAVNLIHAIKA